MQITIGNVFEISNERPFRYSGRRLVWLVMFGAVHQLQFMV